MNCLVTGKEQFATFAGAYKRIGQLSARRKDRQDDKFVHGGLRAFRCCHCQQIHIGHRKESAPPRRVLMEARA